jgi:3-oxoadipate enol-lactonase
MPTVDRGDAQLAYEVTDIVAPWLGEKETILFHHGLGLTSAIWAEWISVLAHRFRLVRFDVRGFGNSTIPPSGYEWSLEALAEDTLAVARAAGVERFHFVGESLGGIIGYWLAIHRPDVLHTMTSVSSSHRGKRIEGGIDQWRALVEREGMEGWSRMMMECRFMPGTLSPAARSWFHEMQAATPAHCNLECSRMLRSMDLGDDLHRITVPTLLLVGDGSPFVPVGIVNEIKDMISSARMQVVAGARHGVVFSHAAHCAMVVQDFIARSGSTQRT